MINVSWKRGNIEMLLILAVMILLVASVFCVCATLVKWFLKKRRRHGRRNINNDRTDATMVSTRGNTTGANPRRNSERVEISCTIRTLNEQSNRQSLNATVLRGLPSYAEVNSDSSDGPPPTYEEAMAFTGLQHWQWLLASTNRIPNQYVWFLALTQLSPTLIQHSNSTSNILDIVCTATVPCLKLICYKSYTHLRSDARRIGFWKMMWLTFRKRLVIRYKNCIFSTVSTFTREIPGMSLRPGFGPCRQTRKTQLLNFI